MKVLKTALNVAVACGIITASAVAQNTRDAELVVSDQDLNQTYAKLMRRLSAADQANMRVAQRHWIQFRDADCKLAIADVRDCLMERTDQRTEQLRSTYYSDKNGNVFSLSSE
jgi:uncharacterized protein YecT (DUF1311 family)